MGKNELKLFAGGSSANIISQEEYEALQARVNGFARGIASPEQVNKVLRQSSFIAAMLGQYIGLNAGTDVLDDGDVDKLMSGFDLSIASGVQSGKWNEAAAVGSGDELLIRLSPRLTEYRRGLVVHVLITATNTGPATLRGDENLEPLPIYRLDGSELFPGDMLPDSILTFVCTGSAWRITSISRQPTLPLQQALTLYVRTDGDDKNDGTGNVPEKAFATLQGAYDYVRNIYTSAGQEIALKLGIPGTYSGLSHDTLSGTVSIVGEVANRANYNIVSGPRQSLSSVHISSGGLLNTIGCSVVTPPVTTAKAVWAENGRIVLDSIHHKLTGVASPSIYHILADTLGFVSLINSHELTGGNGQSIASMIAASGGRIYLGSQAQPLYMNVYQTPDFSNGFAYATEGGVISVRRAYFSGAATGMRYNAILNGTINSSGSGANYFPGSIAGVVDTSTGGVYAN